MTPEDLNSEIKLIFARACAEGLKAEAGSLMDLSSFDLKKTTATQYAAAFSSAFAFVAERFIEGPSSYDEMVVSALRSNPAADSQSGEGKSCPAPDDSLGNTPVSPEVGR
ncbi:hypothetical protein [Pseudomonas extremaustralis]|uniref:Uncharacterized protein n=1 Tax=Pseudomonas extremaustralis TaxID=359110 RepID=A0A5C5PZS6_9PSED|nr:hypothetical protein [Pseudomonas extremaustralis]EZI23365.1 hypothetical protein PE143B_0130510 [Pseudomonas extremaustralis 14-3 substr. 14-3b]TWR96591.1 hypothetical protein FIV36_30625 [Pseudomonas extremaustralis]